MTTKSDKAILEKFTLQDVELSLARKDFWSFCKLMYPKMYKDGREYLKGLCDRLQAFVEDDSRHFLVVNLPPRHGKSLTAQCLTAWLFGRNPNFRVMTGSYNENLSSQFARAVRNLIQTKKVGEKIVYGDIFSTAVKHGEAAASMWTLEGSTQPNYLATSPTGTATGFGCDFLIVDDIIKRAEEAYNENALDGHWSWFVNTMLSRLEGNRKTIIIMTRWAERDLAGRIIEAYGSDLDIVAYSAVQKDGSMLCPDILSREDYDLIVKEMNLDIVEANYSQKPIDVQGRLYAEFKTWDKLPEEPVLNYTDTADTGADFLCSIDYVIFESEAYIKNVVFTDEAMEVTENAVAEMLATDKTTEAEIESNNGGRGFRRNVERILNETHQTNRVIFRDKPQTKNKQSRILASSAWVQSHVYMPPGWKARWPEFHKQIMSYQRKGKNAHDDAVDVLAAIYEKVTDKSKRIVFFN